MLVHLTARSTSGAPLASWETAEKLWRSLRRAFPETLAAVLMPNHPHVITRVADATRARTSLALVLGALDRGSRRAGGRSRWEPVPTPEVIRDLHHLRRQLRYVALNPCRAGLARDPLAWEWSTHRDVVGAIVNPWVSPAALAAAVGTRPAARASFAASWHAYVSGDPSCAVAGTAPPTSASFHDEPALPIEPIVSAAATCTRARPSSVRERTTTRRVFVNLAWRQGWRDTALLARICGVTHSAVRQLLAGADEEEIAAGALCLGDGRLLREGRATPGSGAQNLKVMPARP